MQINSAGFLAPWKQIPLVFLYPTNIQYLWKLEKWIINKPSQVRQNNHKSKCCSRKDGRIINGNRTWTNQPPTFLHSPPTIMECPMQFTALLKLHFTASPAAQLSWDNKWVVRGKFEYSQFTNSFYALWIFYPKKRAGLRSMGPFQWKILNRKSKNEMSLFSVLP